MRVPQTSVIFFALMIGFVVYITLRNPIPGIPGSGQLQQYLYVIGLEGGSSAVASTQGTSGATGATGATGVTASVGSTGVTVTGR